MVTVAYVTEKKPVQNDGAVLVPVRSVDNSLTRKVNFISQ